LSINFATALTIYVQPGNQGIVRLNVTPFQTAIEQRSFEIKNFNNISLTIDLQPNVNITKIIEIEKSFVLQPNESRIVNYTVRVSEPGRYDGNILITFTDPSEASVSYETNLIVIANKVEWDYNQFILPAIVLVVVIVLILILVFKRKLWKRSKT
jgi:hypothetical protein